MARPLFYVGIWQPRMARKLERVIISANRMEGRKSDFVIGKWMLDSGAFTRIRSGRGHAPVENYAAMINRWQHCGELEAAVCQDWMCEPVILDITGLTVEEHQRRSTDAYLSLRPLTPVYTMPVIQGWTPDDYRRHVGNLSPEIDVGAWVGVGSVCKRQGRVSIVSAILTAILAERPDLRLHGFGLKRTALQHADISERIYSADSMAWSYAGRYLTPQRNNDPAFAAEWAAEVETCQVLPSQMAML